ncbi:TPA: hypothetical protein ACSPJ7_005589 [Bacillus cereus]
MKKQVCLIQKFVNNGMVPIRKLNKKTLLLNSALQPVEGSIAVVANSVYNQIKKYFYITINW